MKALVLFTLLTLATTAAKAQGAAADTAFRFTHRLSRVEDTWVVFPKQADIDAYAFGYIYIDPSSGFIFNLEGYFKTDGSGRFTRYKKAVDAKARALYAITPGSPTPLLAVVDPEHYEELDIYPRPDWLSSYTEYTDTLTHNVQWAKAYNAIMDHEKALNFLETMYQTQPHFAGLEAELAHTYNTLNRYNDALKITDAAIKNDPKNASLYKEQGNALLSKGSLDKALESYNTGINLCDEGQMEDKAEMAMRMAIAYRTQNNKAGYKQWIEMAQLWAPKKSDIAKVIADM
jgi:tetratricopeptide (TPR) repeat protein